MGNVCVCWGEMNEADIVNMMFGILEGPVVVVVVEFPLLLLLLLLLLVFMSTLITELAMETAWLQEFIGIHFAAEEPICGRPL